MATVQNEPSFPVMEQSWIESESTSRPPEHPGILKAPAVPLELQKPHPGKTLRFQAKPERMEAQETPQAGCSRKADETSILDSDSSDSSEASNVTPPSSQSASDSNSPERPSSRLLRARASSAPGTDNKAKVSSWLPKRMRRYLAAFTRDKEGSQGKGSQSTATNSRNRERRSSRPSHRRTTGVATERYSGPPSQDDMRWRVALSRYALLTLLGSLTFLLFSAGTLHLARDSGDPLRDKQQPQENGVIDGQRPVAWRYSRTSSQSIALPGHELTGKKAEAETPLPAKAAAKSAEAFPSTGETPVIGRDGEQEEENTSADERGTNRTVPVR